MSSPDAKLVPKSMVTGVTFVNAPQSAMQPNRPKAGNSNGGSQAPSPQGGPAPIVCVEEAKRDVGQGRLERGIHFQQAGWPWRASPGFCWHELVDRDVNGSTHQAHKTRVETNRGRKERRAIGEISPALLDPNANQWASGRRGGEPGTEAHSRKLQTVEESAVPAERSY